MWESWTREKANFCMATGYPPGEYEDLTRQERRIWSEEHKRMNTKD